MIPFFQNTVLQFAASLLYLYTYVFRRIDTVISDALLYTAEVLIVALAAAWQHWQQRLSLAMSILLFWFRIYLVYVMLFYVTPKFFSLQFVVPQEVLNQKGW